MPFSLEFDTLNFLMICCPLLVRSVKHYMYNSTFSFTWNQQFATKFKALKLITSNSQCEGLSSHTINTDRCPVPPQELCRVHVHSPGQEDVSGEEGRFQLPETVYRNPAIFCPRARDGSSTCSLPVMETNQTHNQHVLYD